VKFLFIIFLFTLTNAFSQDEATKESPQVEELRYNFKEDFGDTLEWAWKGSYKQFEGTQNLIFFGLAIASTAYFIENDKRISKKFVRKNKNEKALRAVSDASIFFNTPLLPLTFYAWGRSRLDNKMVQFSKEYFAAQALVLLETAAISMIPVHQRPDQKELSFWEKAFRGQSSFPSGHVVGYSVLAHKSFQFYGPIYSILPSALAIATAFERVHGEKHYISDVIASGFLSFLACEGVRIAAGYEKNHPVYQWIFEHDFSLDYIRKDDASGMQVSFSW
jgi:membrane-associated phospholipid phosphatase